MLLLSELWHFCMYHVCVQWSANLSIKLKRFKKKNNALIPYSNFQIKRR